MKNENREKNVQLLQDLVILSYNFQGSGDTGCNAELLLQKQKKILNDSINYYPFSVTTSDLLNHYAIMIG